MNHTFFKRIGAYVLDVLIVSLLVSLLSYVPFLNPSRDAYSEKYGSKTIRKNITIPAWLNTYGEKRGINFSKVLQEALIAAAKEDKHTMEV